MTLIKRNLFIMVLTFISLFSYASDTLDNDEEKEAVNETLENIIMSFVVINPNNIDSTIINENKFTLSYNPLLPIALKDGVNRGCYYYLGNYSDELNNFEKKIETYLVKDDLRSYIISVLHKINLYLIEEISISYINCLNYTNCTKNEVNENNYHYIYYNKIEDLFDDNIPYEKGYINRQIITSDFFIFNDFIKLHLLIVKYNRFARFLSSLDYNFVKQQYPDYSFIMNYVNHDDKKKNEDNLEEIVDEIKKELTIYESFYYYNTW